VHRRWFGWRRAAATLEPRDSDDAPIERQEQAERVRAAINSLGPRYREVIVLHYLEELGIDQIAQLVGSRRNAIEVKLHRARQQLAKLLAVSIK
jgi:RNA polymerase sigma-70 factor (ECF subfamily)